MKTQNNIERNRIPSSCHRNSTVTEPANERATKTETKQSFLDEPPTLMELVLYGLAHICLACAIGAMTRIEFGFWRGALVMLACCVGLRAVAEFIPALTRWGSWVWYHASLFALLGSVIPFIHKLEAFFWTGAAVLFSAAWFTTGCIFLARLWQRHQGPQVSGGIGQQAQTPMSNFAGHGGGSAGQSVCKGYGD